MSGPGRIEGSKPDMRMPGTLLAAHVDGGIVAEPEPAVRCWQPAAARARAGAGRSRRRALGARGRRAGVFEERSGGHAPHDGFDIGRAAGAKLIGGAFPIEVGLGADLDRGAEFG